MGLFWQVLGYGWAGLLRKYVVEPAHMWWPGTLVQIALFRRVFKPPFFFFCCYRGPTTTIIIIIIIIIKLEF